MQADFRASLGGDSLELRSEEYFGKNGDLMSLTEEQEAWLEREGEAHVLHGNCSIGRAALNTVVLDSQKVSRLHSIIHLEDNGAFWLIDLGSSNGTLLNKRRIHEPIRLRDGDEINIGGIRFRFCQPHGKPSAGLRATAPPATLQQVEDVECWLLVADIKDFTPLSRSVASDRLAALVSSWLAECKMVIEQHQGTINKYLGDGILAYWRDSRNTPMDILAVVAGLKKKQQGDGPFFRFVVHFGSVAIGGVTAMREETLMGSSVNLIFRLEKLLASLGEPCAISDAARARLGESLPCRSLGEHNLKGFQQKCALFSV
jgi:class 3 adenylate cyclase